VLDKFQIQTAAELQEEGRRLNLSLPMFSPVTILSEPLMLEGVQVPNRLCVQPMEGRDAGAGGVPGELTLRRYRRYAEGGFGLIWLEATAVDGQCRSNPRQLWISRRTVKGFAELVKDIRQAARHRWGHEVILILQLAHAGRYSDSEGVADPMIAQHVASLDRPLGIPDDYPLVSDEYLDRLQDRYVTAAGLAMEAGFNGVDVKACHGDLVAELLTATTRPGRYGGSFENRTRFLRETTGRLRAALPDCILASRITAYTEPVKLAQSLQEAGVRLLSIAGGNAAEQLAVGQESSLEKFARLFEMTRTVQQAVPAVSVVAGGFSWFRHLLPEVAAGVLQDGGAKLIGVGRAALAYPALAGDLIRGQRLEPDQCCINCSACMQLIKDGGRAGCAVMDSEIYGEEYRHRRHFAMDHLQDEARRCLACEPAPCRSACPVRIDVPAFLKAFAEADVVGAYEIIRARNTLPGMCAHLCPVGRMCEGRCVANTLEGNPIPIHDIQYVVSWLARQRGVIGVRVPAWDTGKRVAVVGGGPAGIACAVTLLERGHHVVLFERAARLGGIPERVIRASRYAGAGDEIDAILQPALSEARLVLRFGCELGRAMTLAELRHEHAAVFLATGVWGERSIGCADGVVDGVNFLRRVRANEVRSVPPRVIILAGGDSAMDSAVVARELGARELTIVYGGALSEMHWHMPDSWFRTEGVQFMMSTRPVGYRVEADGKVSGLKVRPNVGSVSTAEAVTDSILAADLVIEAMGLGLEKGLVDALAGCELNEQGLVRRVSGSSYSCGLPGVYVGGALINGGASVVQCVAEGMAAGCEIDAWLGDVAK
jgi:NADPH-dependent glutamate synthase beta subunit-like oxidoreductase/2,4-dienoyl-CoA reductase-like NADH-dependent reductase (Old Yellow Enzyme family)